MVTPDHSHRPEIKAQTRDSAPWCDAILEAFFDIHSQCRYPWVCYKYLAWLTLGTDTGQMSVLCAYRLFPQMGNTGAFRLWT